MSIYFILIVKSTENATWLLLKHFNNSQIARNM